MRSSTRTKKRQPSQMKELSSEQQSQTHEVSSGVSRTQAQTQLVSPTRSKSQSRGGTQQLATNYREFEQLEKHLRSFIGRKNITIKQIRSKRLNSNTLMNQSPKNIATMSFMNSEANFSRIKQPSTPQHNFTPSMSIFKTRDALNATTINPNRSFIGEGNFTSEKKLEPLSSKDFNSLLSKVIESNKPYPSGLRPTSVGRIRPILSKEEQNQIDRRTALLSQLVLSPKRHVPNNQDYVDYRPHTSLAALNKEMLQKSIGGMQEESKRPVTSMGGPDVRISKRKESSIQYNIL